MSTLKLERDYAADPETVFAFVTKAENIIKWWGPEGMGVKEEKLDLSKPGSWTSTLVNAEGGRYKVSGQVTAIEAPNWVEFTWAWHDENDVRGHESKVRFEVKSNGNGGTHFVMTHTGLADEESAKNHEEGWISTFVKLERLAN